MSSYDDDVERWARWFGFLDRHPWLYKLTPRRFK